MDQSKKIKELEDRISSLEERVRHLEEKSNGTVKTHEHIADFGQPQWQGDADPRLRK